MSDQHAAFTAWCKMHDLNDKAIAILLKHEFQSVAGLAFLSKPGNEETYKVLQEEFKASVSLFQQSALTVAVNAANECSQGGPVNVRSSCACIDIAVGGKGVAGHAYGRVHTSQTSMFSDSGAY